MLAQRSRRWANIKTKLVYHLVFAHDGQQLFWRLFLEREQKLFSIWNQMN